MKLTGGSLFTGMGGLDLAVAWALHDLGIDVRFLWDADIKPAAVTFLAHHRPFAPNLGDITVLDTDAIPSVDLLTFGWPCQPHSAAGKRLGEADPRALWPHVARIIAGLRPAYLFGENVARVATNGELRRVVQTLAEVGYVGAWRCVRASDVGAPHRRDRLFLFGVRDDVAADSLLLQLRDEPGRGGGSSGSGAGVAGDDGATGAAGGLTLLPTPGARLGMSGNVSLKVARDGSPRTFRQLDLPGAVNLLPTPGARLGASGSVQPAAAARAARRGNGPNLDDVAALLPPAVGPEWMMGYSEDGNPPEVRPGEALSGLRKEDVPEAIQRSTGGSNSIPGPTDMLPELREHQGRGRQGHAALEGSETSPSDVRGLPCHDRSARASQGSEPGEQRSSESGDAVQLVSPASALERGSPTADGRRPKGATNCGCSAWGQYSSAVHRWEMELGRIAPVPALPTGRDGQMQLSAQAVEFMMGLPEGWVTDVPGLTRGQQLSMLGDGVVPQQARHAYRLLINELAATVKREEAS